MKREIQLEQLTIDELAQLAYEAWCDAYDTAKQIATEQNDSSPDWTLFHKARKEATVRLRERYKRMFDEILPYTSTVAK